MRKYEGHSTPVSTLPNTTGETEKEGIECRREMEGVRGLSVQDARQDSAPGMSACITRAVLEKKLHSTPAHRALEVSYGERKTRL